MMWLIEMGAIRTGRKIISININAQLANRANIKRPIALFTANLYSKKLYTISYCIINLPAFFCIFSKAQTNFYFPIVKFHLILLLPTIFLVYFSLIERVESYLCDYSKTPLWIHYHSLVSIGYNGSFLLRLLIINKNKCFTKEYHVMPCFDTVSHWILSE